MQLPTSRIEMIRHRQPLACALIFTLFVVGSTLTTRQSQASNNSLLHPAASTAQEADTANAETQARLSEAYGKLSLSFEANRGQFDPQAQFLARGGGYNLFLTTSEAVLVLSKPPASKEKHLRDKSPFSLEQAKDVRAKRGKLEAVERLQELKRAAPQSAVLRMKLEGANPSAQAQGLDELPSKTNYFIGSDPQKWQTDIPSYARIMYREVYPGVDLIYYGKQQQLEYDFVVAPGVDPAKIKLNFEGAQSIEVDAQGDLILHTEAGDVRQQKPVVYQEVDGRKRDIPSRYEMMDGQRVGFHVDAYDVSKPLVIDPVLLYSTFLGGSNTDQGVSIAVDAKGNAYVTGTTSSPDFPLVNSLPLSRGAVFVSKLNRSGSALIYSTYIGGANSARSIAVDREGSAYITGSVSASSPVFPVVNAVQSTPGGESDPFALKLSPQGSAIVYSTYLGGSADDGANAIAVDAAGDAYVTGYTLSPDFATANAFQATNADHPAFQSTDGGGSWSTSANGLNAAGMRDVVLVPSNPDVLYSASDEGVFKSTDGGDSWHAANRGLEYAQRVYCLAVDPRHPATVFAGADYGVFRSTNGGRTWRRSVEAYIVEDIAIDPVNTSNIYAAAVAPDGYTYGALYKSTDDGQTWTSKHLFDSSGAELYVTSLAVDPNNSSVVYAGTFQDGVYKSTDAGGHWRPANRGLWYQSFVEDLAFDPTNSSTVYAATVYGFYKSTDAGGHWRGLNNGLDDYGFPDYIRTLAIDPAHPSVIYISTYYRGVFKTTDGGGHWKPANMGLNNRIVTGIALDPRDTSHLNIVAQCMSDVFVTKLNPSGSTRLYSTYLGGNASDQGYGIALDSEGNAYLTGLSHSLNFPVQNALKATYAGAFVTKLDATGSSLVYSTYLGSDDTYFDEVGYGIAVDSSGNAYVTGEVWTKDFPVTPGAFQTRLRGQSDAFVTKINPSGSSFVYSTYLGGNDRDPDYFYFEYGNAIAVNSAGQVFVTGQTLARNFPVVNEIQSTLHGTFDAFVTKLNATGSALAFSTYLGGSDPAFDKGSGIALDPAGNVYVVGSTSASDFPTTPNAFRKYIPYSYEASDAFITKIGPPQAAIQISGSVLYNGAGLDGATVTLKNKGGSVLQTTTTAARGSYSFKNLPGGGSYTVTPSKQGYAFTPQSLSYTRLGTDATGQNFGAWQPSFFLQTRVVDIFGNGVGGVKLLLSGSRNDTCTSDSYGYCFLGTLPSDGNYTVTPSKAGATFNPASKTFNNPVGLFQYANFKAAFNIGGRITGAGGIGIGGVTLELSGDRRGFTTTDSQGRYRFNNLPLGGSYSVRPHKGGMTFNPTFAAYNFLDAPVTANFQALVSISGKVRLQGTTSGIGGVAVKLTGSRNAITMTGSDGIYTFADLPAGGDYMVKPVKPGFTFDPSSRTFTDLKMSQGLTSSYFDGTP